MLKKHKYTLLLVGLFLASAALTMTDKDWWHIG
ncbi:MULTISPECIES: quorum-sensing system DWW-type pheromone [Streptococcus]|uniref:Uncharacterized protein n=2 Tax=Streptococcus TaxID=1301 RepID=A0A4V0GYS5_STRPO|nr:MULTISPECIES: quorum-sensing system DWW-type pheromone [Streptococcus]SQG42265.1 Uncharacterised protein [Streptococcus porcinus]VEF93816.1 Uncharacterised protein [Streptococcus pseudoporcinus]VTT41402.1 Uncharacterised protein [Streptococcus porcinus]VTT42076.1 Uncharacterised protein [Streptococcus porcinus]